MKCCATYTPIEGVTLVCGDARDVAPHMGERAQFTATDPPYKMQSGGNSGTHFTGGKMGNYANDGAPVECNITWNEKLAVVDAVSADQSDIIVMANASLGNIFEAYIAAMKAGLRYHNLGEWDKGAPTPGRWLMMHLEFILYLYKGKAVALNNPSQKQRFAFGRSNETDHPTEKPVALMKRWCNLVGKPGDLVCDPFMGSGTTGVAAIQAGRRFYGIEKDPDHYATACKRIDKAIEHQRWMERQAS